MAWTQARTWIVGEILTAAFLNQQLRDNLNWLYNGPECIVRRTASQSITQNVLTAVSFDLEDRDIDAMWDVALPTRLTAVHQGKYWVNYVVVFAAVNAQTERYTEITRSDAQVYGIDQRPSLTSATLGTTTTASSLIEMTAGVYVEIKARQASAAALNLTARAAIVGLGNYAAT